MAILVGDGVHTFTEARESFSGTLLSKALDQFKSLTQFSQLSSLDIGLMDFWTSLSLLWFSTQHHQPVEPVERSNEEV